MELLLPSWFVHELGAFMKPFVRMALLTRSSYSSSPVSASQPTLDGVTWLPALISSPPRRRSIGMPATGMLSGLVPKYTCAMERT